MTADAAGDEILHLTPSKRVHGFFPRWVSETPERTRYHFLPCFVRAMSWQEEVTNPSHRANG